MKTKIMKEKSRVDITHGRYFVTVIGFVRGGVGVWIEDLDKKEATYKLEIHHDRIDAIQLSTFPPIIPSIARD